MAAYLGNIKWGAQIGWRDANGNTSTKTINGLNLDETGGSDADASNAGKINTLASLMDALSSQVVISKTLTEMRGVLSNG